MFPSQAALADAIGCARNTVSRAVRTATHLFGEMWIDRLVRPVMHEFTIRSAERLAQALADDGRHGAARRRAKDLVPGALSAGQLHEALFGAPESSRRTVFVRRGGKRGRGPVAARIERDEAGNWSVNVRAHEQSPADMAELAEHIEAVLAAETSPAGGVRLGRRLAGLLTAEAAAKASQSWLEGCVWAAARGSGLDWDRWRCAGVAQALRAQRGGWERAVARAVGGREGDAPGSPGTGTGKS